MKLCLKLNPSSVFRFQQSCTLQWHPANTCFGYPRIQNLSSHLWHFRSLPLSTRRFLKCWRHVLHQLLRLKGQWCFFPRCIWRVCPGLCFQFWRPSLALNRLDRLFALLRSTFLSRHTSYLQSGCCYYEALDHRFLLSSVKAFGYERQVDNRLDLLRPFAELCLRRNLIRMRPIWSMPL